MLNRFSHIAEVLESRGRIGRLKFFNYSMAIPLLVGVISITAYSSYHSLGFALEHKVDLADFIWHEFATSFRYAVLIYIPLHYIFTLLVGVARFHDMNKPGWYTFFLLIPFSPYIFYLWPGNKEKNLYGLPPVKNDFLDWMPLVGVLAFFLAVYGYRFF